MSRTLAQRELAKLRKQRQRQRERERDRLAAEVQAAIYESIAEELAPRILRKPLWDGERMIVGARVVVENGRPVRALLLVEGSPADGHTFLTRNSPQFTARHRQAAHKLQQDWSDVGAGVGVGAMDYLKSGGRSGEGVGGHKAMLAQIDARRRLEAALAFMGAFAPGVMRVVLDCVPVNVWASDVGMTVSDATAWLVLALNRLALFYWPPAPERQSMPGNSGILTIGPPRADYSTELEN